ncbi:MAG TPA: response regulator transcription factor [Gemmatimonadaceae bacterium]|nr:response regulator transcription factor [Gemmatimonadaceae bacterium]
MGNILVIEDNEDIANGLRDNLELEGHAVRTAETGALGVAEAKGWNPDVIILDLGLPDMDGHHVMRQLPREGVTSGILILSARDAEAEKVVGLRLGAEDYVTKPFGMLELLARVELILRRGRVAAAPLEIVAPQRAIVRLGPLEIDRDARQVKRHGRLVSLSPKEFDLLDALIGRGGAVVKRSDLLREVWGYSGFVSSRTVDTHIAQLRRKLESDPANPEFILTVQKAGYRMAM